MTADGVTTSTVTVTLRNALNNPAVGVTATLSQGSGHSTISAASGPSDLNGQITFTVKSTVAETVTYTATAAGLQVTQTAQVAFAPGTTTQLVFSAQPGSATAGSTFGQQPVVEIEDANGNLITSGSDSTINVTMSITAGGGSLQGTTTVAAIGGIASFTDLRIDASGTHTLRAAGTVAINGAIGADSGTFNVSPAAADRIAFTAAPTSSTAGVESSNITATLKDQFGNDATRGTAVTITPVSTSSGSNKAFRDTSSATHNTFAITAGSSSVSFRYYDEKAGGYSLSITSDASSPSLTNPAPIAFTVNPAAASQLTLSGATSSAAGVNSSALTATMRDAFGNLATRGGDVTITPTSDSAGAQEGVQDGRRRRAADLHDHGGHLDGELPLLRRGRRRAHDQPHELGDGADAREPVGGLHGHRRRSRPDRRLGRHLVDRRA